MEIRHILFDLDGTLLPMIQEKFVRFYMPLLAKTYISRGVELEPKDFIASVWSGYEAMVKNDGTRTNREAFWAHMEEKLPISLEESEEIALDFYANEFNEAIRATKPSPAADQIVKAAREKGIETYLATNPVFPRCATMNRIRWAGLDAGDFKEITTYEYCRYCKPSLEYFREILEKYGLDPAECLMVGEDVEEDLSIRSLGVRTYLVTDTLEDRKGIPYETDYMGTLSELLEFVKSL